MADKKSNLLLWIVLGGGGLLFFILCLLALTFSVPEGGGSSFTLSTNQIAVIDLQGLILDSREFTELLKEYGGRASVRAVVIRINSPGGGVAASQEIYESVRRFRAQSKKKVVVSMASVAASGGYYIACAADRIVANPGSITGSIGVIAEWFNYGDLLRWAKMESIVIKSGVLKDAGSPTRPLNEVEKVYFQGLIDNLYNQFVAAVANSRKMKEDSVRKLADGRVFTGQEARNNGLVDELGTFQDAVATAAKMSGIVGEPRIVAPPKKQFSLLDLIFGDSRALVPLNGDRSESHIRFQYLWR